MLLPKSPSPFFWLSCWGITYWPFLAHMVHWDFISIIRTELMVHTRMRWNPSKASHSVFSWLYRFVQQWIMWQPQLMKCNVNFAWISREKRLAFSSLDFTRPQVAKAIFQPKMRADLKTETIFKEWAVRNEERKTSSKLFQQKPWSSHVQNWSDSYTYQLFEQ